MIGRVLIGAAALVFGLSAPAFSDPGQSPGCADHIHVKGHVQEQNGRGVSGAQAFWGEGGVGGGAAVSKDLPFLQGLPDRCFCNMRSVQTAGDGSFDLKIEIANDPRCTSAIDRVTVDKTKLFWRKQGVTIVPAP